MKRAMNLIKSLSIVMIFVVISLGVAEFGLRLIFPRQVSVSVNVLDHSDPYLPKIAEGEYRDDKLDVVASFDSDGFRRNPFECQNRQGIKRLLLVGDSNIAGMFLSDNDSLGSQITKLSLASSECIHVDSFGVPGFGPDQTYKAIESITKDNEYDFVVFHIFADNDLGDLVRNRSYQYNKIQDIGYCYPKRSFLDSLVFARAVRKAIYLASGYFVLWNEVVSSLGGNNNCEMTSYPSTGSFAEIQFERARIEKEGFLDGRRQIYMGDRYDIEFACHTDKQLDSYVREALTTISISMKQLSTDRGFEFIYLIQPSEFDTTNNHADDSSSIIQMCGAEYVPTNLRDYFVDALEGATILDIYSAFDGCNECYFTEEELGSDNHWSAHGVQKVAELLVKTIGR